MPNTPVSQEIGWYLSGYADGEGCFCVSFSPRKKLLSQLEVRPSFSVSQNGDRAEVLSLFRKALGCGSVRPDSSDRTFKFEVRSLNELVSKIIPFFRRFPLKSSKAKDFDHFSLICSLMAEGNQWNGIGLRRIVGLAYKMNSSGKRKYIKAELLSIAIKV